MEKLKNLTWKQKNRLLCGGLLFALWCIYSFAISTTLDARTLCLELQQSIDSSAGAPEKIAELENELAHFKNLTGSASNLHSDSATHENLLNLVTEYCGAHRLLLREFNSPLVYAQEEWIVETHPFTIEGDFIRIVQLLDYLRTNVSGKVVSADIHSKTDNKTKTTALLVTIYVQKISIIPT